MKLPRVICAVSCLLALGAVAGPASAKTRPNLKVTAISVSAKSVEPGRSFVISVTTANSNPGRARPSKNFFALSLDRKVSKHDFALSGSQKLPYLSKHLSVRRSATTRVPAKTPPGMYYVTACADGPRKVA